MKRNRVLVHDKKNIFIKMFKKKFNDEFEFIDSNSLYGNQNELKNFDNSIIAVYSKNELTHCLKSDNEKHAIIICLFDTPIDDNLIFWGEINNLLLLDGSKTKSEIIIDLRKHLQNRSTYDQKTNRLEITTSIYKFEFNNILKGVIFLN